MIAGAALEAARPDLDVVTAGTLTVDGLPISTRTRAALDAIGLSPPLHRSKQAGAGALAAADLVVALAAEHVRWVRREHPAARHRTAQLRMLADRLPAGDTPLVERVAELRLDLIEPETVDDVVDPGGGAEPEFVACAIEIASLIARLAGRL